MANINRTLEESLEVGYTCIIGAAIGRCNRTGMQATRLSLNKNDFTGSNGDIDFDSNRELGKTRRPVTACLGADLANVRLE